MKTLFTTYAQAYATTKISSDGFTALNAEERNKASLNKIVFTDAPEEVKVIRRGNGFMGRAACWIEDNVLSLFKQLKIGENEDAKNTIYHFTNSAKAVIESLHLNESQTSEVTELITAQETRLRNRQPARAKFVNEILNEIVKVAKDHNVKYNEIPVFAQTAFTSENSGVYARQATDEQGVAPPKTGTESGVGDTGVTVMKTISRDEQLHLKQRLRQDIDSNKRGILTDKCRKAAKKKAKEFLAKKDTKRYTDSELEEMVESNITKELNNARFGDSGGDVRYMVSARAQLDLAIATHNQCAQQPENSINEYFVEMGIVTRKWNYDHQFERICDDISSSFAGAVISRMIHDMHT